MAQKNASNRFLSNMDWIPGKTNKTICLSFDDLTLKNLP